MNLEEPEFNQFRDAFYNWMLDNGMDIFVKGSKMTKSSLPDKWHCEINPAALKDGIQALVNEEVATELKALSRWISVIHIEPHDEGQNEDRWITAASEIKQHTDAELARRR